MFRFKILSLPKVIEKKNMYKGLMLYVMTPDCQLTNSRVKLEISIFAQHVNSNFPEVGSCELGA